MEPTPSKTNGKTPTELTRQAVATTKTTTSTTTTASSTSEVATSNRWYATFSQEETIFHKDLSLSLHYFQKFQRKIMPWTDAEILQLEAQKVKEKLDIVKKGLGEEEKQYAKQNNKIEVFNSYLLMSKSKL